MHNIEKLKLEEYCALLLKWNKSINLISKSTERDIWMRHVLDCRQLISFMDQDVPVIDIGSGAGLPGVIVSIGGVKNVQIIESDSRKCSFLHLASRISSNQINIINKRIEDVEPRELDCNSKLISRALAPLVHLMDYYFALGLVGGMLFLKGKNYTLELEEASSFWDFEYNIHNSLTSNNSVILDIKNARKKTQSSVHS